MDWDFTLANYGPVWSFMVQFGLLLLFLVLGNILRRMVPLFRKGFVLGVGAKMFTIAGPVIVYGTVASVVYGLIYWITTLF